jgi:SNF2 family DNA or RNA helicase
VIFLLSRQAAVLADEMGLGKTVQTLVALRVLCEQGELRRGLLLAPKSLIPNWQRELARWAGNVSTQIIGGPAPQRRWLWQHSDARVQLAHYEILAQDAALLVQLVRQRKLFFDVLILDEAHRIKNPRGITCRLLQSLPRRRVWALTGTPLENCLQDLQGIFSVVRPGLLLPQMSLAQIRAAIRPYVLRRTKDVVAREIPRKIFRDRLLELRGEQAIQYRETESRARDRLSALGDQISVRHIFVQILRLKQICNFDPVTGRSVKLDQLEEDLRLAFAEGGKAIVFSQFVSTLERLSQRLSFWRPLVFHGGLTPEEREEALREFREDPARPLLLLSYRAGGVGLNLQFASYVFLFDRWWNPAVEDQAINRVHRLGSRRPVVVTRYLVAGTIEERIDSLLESKRSLFQRVFSGLDSGSMLQITKAEWLKLFGGEIAPSPEGQIMAA